MMYHFKVIGHREVQGFTLPGNTCEHPDMRAALTFCLIRRCINPCTHVPNCLMLRGTPATDFLSLLFLKNQKKEKIEERIGNETLSTVPSSLIAPHGSSVLRRVLSWKTWIFLLSYIRVEDDRPYWNKLFTSYFEWLKDDQVIKTLVRLVKDSDGRKGNQETLMGNLANFLRLMRHLQKCLVLPLMMIFQKLN